MSERVDKPWGFEETLDSNEEYIVKRLAINAGCRLSLQYHEIKTETLFLEEGSGYVLMQNEDGIYEKIEMDVKDKKVFIEPGVIHRICAYSFMSLFEVSTPDPDDIVRLEDDYERI